MLTKGKKISVLNVAIKMIYKYWMANNNNNNNNNNKRRLSKFDKNDGVKPI